MASPLVFLSLILLATAQPPIEEEPEEILGAPADWAITGTAATRPTIDLQPDTPIHEDPSDSTPIVAIFVGGTLPVWTTRLGWAQVIWDDLIGWVELVPGGDTPTRPGPRPLPPVPPRSYPDSEILATARSFLPADTRAVAIGTFDLYRDSPDRRQDELFATLSAQLEKIYAERYGLAKSRPPTGAVFAFSSDEPFHALVRILATSQATDFSGLTSGGVALVRTGNRPRKQIARTFLHETAHLWNRHLLGEGLPVWLEEGLAEDLTLSDMTASGRLRPDLVSKEVRRIAGITLIPPTTVMLAALSKRARLRSLTSTAVLLEMDQQSFLHDDDRLIRYVQSGLFIRFLLENAQYRDVFHAFLGHVAETGAASGADLLERLQAQQPKTELDESFRNWILSLDIPEVYADAESRLSR